MAEPTPGVESAPKKAAAKLKLTAESGPEPVAVSRQLAGSSPDPVVQRIIAEIDIHRRNGDEGKVAELTAQLATLGYE